MADNATSGDAAVTTAEATDPKTASTTNVSDTGKTASSSQGFDPTTLSDEEFAKVFADPRTFQHERFKSLSERAKEADKLKSEAEKAENARLAEEKKYQELAQKHEQSANDWKSKFETSSIDNRIQAEAAKLGITDIEAATKLIDRSGINIDTSGTVNGVEEAVKALAESKPYLVDKTKQVPTIGSPTNPNNNVNQDGSVKTFKASEIRDPSFYKEHEKDILTALKTPGAIINDLGNKL